MYKYLSAITLFLMAYLLSCNSNENVAQRKKNIEKLPATIYAINTAKDTLLKTSKGALLFIPKGALQGANPLVQLSIREAYSMSDIVLAGLITISGGKPLSSGGMIQIVPADKAVKMVKAIKVSLPTDFYRKDMQVFKGNELPDGSIDWTEPTPMMKDTVSIIVKGERLYMQDCGSCHRLDKDATGPALAFAFQRLDKEWIRKFTRNPAGMIAEDPYASDLFCRWAPTVMAAFPSLTDADFDCLEAYLNNESRKIDPATAPPDLRKSFDSCQAYLQAKTVLDDKTGLKTHLQTRDRLITDNANDKYEEPQVIYKQGPVHYIDGTGLVAPVENKAVYYQFTVERYGWYNVDLFIDQIPDGFISSQLTVKPTGEYKAGLNIYLVIPSEKIFIPGGPLKDKQDIYGFYKEEGEIPLPQNKPAYIISFSDVDGNIIMGTRQFITTRKNELSFSLAKVSKKEFDKAIRGLDIKDLPITVADTKNADAIRKEDAAIKAIRKSKDFSALEKMKPKNIHCPSCMSENDSI